MVYSITNPTQIIIMLIFLIAGCNNKDKTTPQPRVVLSAPQNFLPGVGSSLQLTASVTNANIEDITFTSENEEVASVDSQGLVTANKVGATSILATVASVNGSIAVEVYPVNGKGMATFDIKFIKDVMKAGDFPGAAVSVVKNGKLVMAKGYGFADLDNRSEVTPSSLFRIASVTKPITGVATLKLIENGELSLEDKIFDLIPEFLPSEGPADERLLDITINDLIHHKGGWDKSIIPDPIFNPRDVASDLGIPSPPTAYDYVRWIAMQPLQFTPSQKFSYHNFNYMLLGRVIEKLKGSYEEYVREHVFPFMGISETKIGKTRKEERQQNEVTYYAANSGPSHFDAYPGNVSYAYGGAWGFMNVQDASGGWISNVIELARFAISVDGDQSTPEFLSPGMQAYMITDFGYSYGAGFILASDNYNHNGALNGSISNLVLFNNGITYSFLLNTTNIPISVFPIVENLIKNQNWEDVDYFNEL